MEKVKSTDFKIFSERQLDIQFLDQTIIRMT